MNKFAEPKGSSQLNAAGACAYRRPAFVLGAELLTSLAIGRRLLLDAAILLNCIYRIDRRITLCRKLNIPI